MTTAPPSRLETPVTPRVVLADKEVNAPANGVVVPITTLLIWLPPPDIVPDNVTAGIGPTMVVAAPTDVTGPVKLTVPLTVVREVSTKLVPSHKKVIEAVVPVAGCVQVDNN